MPKLNKLLATSIIADIRECVWVANEIYSWVGDIEHLSWKFPTKTAKDVNAMEVVKEHNGTAGEFYILLLELAYDRMHYILRLIVEFMDKYPSVEDFFKEVTLVKRPSQISLASLLRLVWDRLKTMPESISRQMVKNRKDEEAQEFFARKVSRSSQAASTLNYCESCTLAGETVLQAIKAIERVFVENKLISAAVTERDGSRIDIYARTQWSVMSRLTKGIEMDVETALSRMREGNLRTETTRRELEETVRDLRADMSRYENLVEALQTNNLSLENVLENEKKVLEKTRQRAIILERENDKLEETLKDTRRQISDLTGGNNILQSQATNLAENKLELEKTVIRLRKDVVDTRHAYFETERLRALLDESRKENDSIKESQRTQIEQLQEEITSLRMTIETQKNKEKNKNTDDSISNKEKEDTMIKPEDDPVADMTRQLIANREKIEVLTRQNERLSKTLSRLKQYRLLEQMNSTGTKK